MAKIAKTGDRKKVMDTQKSTDCPKCSKPTRIVKRVKDRERGVPLLREAVNLREFSTESCTKIRQSFVQFAQEGEPLRSPFSVVCTQWVRGVPKRGTQCTP
jgi:hypothetical protein